MLEFLRTCVDESYKIPTQVSLALCEIDSYLDKELRKFFFRSSVDALITDSDYKPCLVVYFQSSYHDSTEAKERDRKKATLLNLARVPLIYSRLKEFGLLHLFSKDEEVVFNLFTGEGRSKAEAIIRKYCKQIEYIGV
ncbi:DUF2726 domain-containing protein [Microseira wollei]|uniref:DUF2726 domain-containing protein n=1 Tax=Microseira wollei NIES-4236 TaxID=2530354 RepID=A0AAV3XPJ9_9CYAN|nr:DUF2726 domain-containing protein [Microseira wollei]GET43626.1 hypothetical protein MiSe_84510 [Microseira wollei NIES-4236]